MTIATQVKKTSLDYVTQGDVFEDVDLVEYVTRQENFLTVSRIRFPYVVVLTQDCDLVQDQKVRSAESKDQKNQDKLLFSVLVSPLYNVEHIRAGDHLSDINHDMQRIDSRKWKSVRNNEIPRYHYLEFPDSVPLPNSVIDFKHYFSVNLAYLQDAKTTRCRVTIAELFREDIAHRFAAYLSRIALPDPRDTQPGNAHNK